MRWIFAMLLTAAVSGCAAPLIVVEAVTVTAEIPPAALAALAP